MSRGLDADNRPCIFPVRIFPCVFSSREGPSQKEPTDGKEPPVVLSGIPCAFSPSLLPLESFT